MVGSCYDYINLAYFSDMWIVIHTFILANTYLYVIKCTNWTWKLHIKRTCSSPHKHGTSTIYLFVATVTLTDQTLYYTFTSDTCFIARIMRLVRHESVYL